MKTNYTLQHAITVALMLLGVGASETASAIGLGDIDVKSHLGQPLRAKLKVQGINSLNDASCFKLVGNADGTDSLKSANFKLVNLVNSEATLIVSSNQVINDPILNVSLTTDCETSVRRDYVLLLDPLLNVADDNSTTPDEAVGVAAVIKPVTAKASSKKHKSVTSQTDSNTDSESSVAPKERHQSQAAMTRPTSEQKANTKIARALTDDTPPSINATSKPANNATDGRKITGLINKPATPRLSISGGNLGNLTKADANSALALRLDSQLHFTPSEDPQAFSADAEVQDEVTVMNNRLAHLEKQLTSLKTRNNLLEMADKARVQQIEQDKKQANVLRWLAYILGAGLLAGTIFAADWWRRRKLNMQLSNSDAWGHAENPSAETALHGAVGEQHENFVHDIGIGSVPTNDAPNEVAPKSALSADELDFSAAKPEFMASKVETVVVEEDILDHADVFLSHGRAGLAIQLLQNHLLEHPERSMTVWLFLLDLLAQEGLEEDYKVAATECKKHFNVELPAYALPLASNGNGIESYNVITSHLTDVWQTDEALPFLDGLIYNNRLQPRTGFNHSTFEELALLKGLAQEHQQTAQIIPLFQKSPANKTIAVKPVVAKASATMKMPPIMLDAGSTINDAAAEKPEEDSYGFDLVEWK